MIPIESPFPNKTQLYNELLASNFLHTTGMLIKNNVIDVVGKYDESISIEDWDICLRIAKEYPIHAREAGEGLAEVALSADSVQIRCVDQVGCLLA